MKTIPAIYENGVFKPKSPVDLPPGYEVEVVMPESEDELVAAVRARFPNSFGGLPDKDADEMMKAIEEECERIDA